MQASRTAVRLQSDQVMHFAEQVYHIYNQGINRQPIFHKREDYLYFLFHYIQLFHNTVSTIAWNLLPNHFHFMIQTDHRSVMPLQQGSIEIDVLSNNVRILLSTYARYFNNKYKRTGNLFRQKTKFRNLSFIDESTPQFETKEDILQKCFDYIHMNPVSAKLVTAPEYWEFSSYRDFTGIRKETFCDIELAKKLCLYDPETFKIRD